MADDISKVESMPGINTLLIFKGIYGEVLDTITDHPLKKLIYGLPKFIDTTVLLVEDNMTNQYITIKVLKGWNIKVDVAINGLEAFKKFQANHYDLILMDTHMPVMNGIEATKKIRAEIASPKNRIPIISFSASLLESEKIEAREAGADDFIEKPFEPEILNSKIHNLLSIQVQSLIAT